MIQFRLQKQLYAATGTMQMNISCEIPTGKLVSLYGASGAGKTSVLRMLAGLMRPDQGEVQVDDELWFDSAKGLDLPAQKRSIGLVFQDYALFPNMTVKQNLQFALKKGEPETLIDELMSITELVQLHKRNVLTLSGGQKQRVALARALVRRPKLLLLDEPLSAIENELRDKLQDMLIKLHRRYNLTTILVSHDPGELARLSDQIFFIESGLIKRQGSPADIFFQPQNEGNYKLAGYIAEIKKEGDACVFYVMIGDQLIRYQPGEEEINAFKKGDRIVLKTQTQVM